jgi:hypothetical protein
MSILPLLSILLALLPAAPLYAQVDFPMCDLYPPAVASRILGRTVTNSVPDSGDLPWWGCLHQAEGAASSISLNRHPSAAEVKRLFARVSDAGGAAPVPNLGDAAVLQVCGGCANQLTLTVGRGQYMIELSVTTYPVPARPDLDALAAAVKPVLDAIDDPSARPVPTAAPTASPAASTGTAGGRCDPTLATTVSDLLGRSDVRVTVDGNCRYIWIATNLAGATFDVVPVAQQICDSAAEVAYVGPITAITVTGSSGAELAAGIKGLPCIGEL